MEHMTGIEPATSGHPAGALTPELHAHPSRPVSVGTRYASGSRARRAHELDPQSETSICRGAGVYACRVWRARGFFVQSVTVLQSRHEPGGTASGGRQTQPMRVLTVPRSSQGALE